MNMKTDKEKYITMAECYNRSRREVDRLKEALGKESQASREFDRENEDVFSLVRKNHRRPQENNNEED